MAKNKQHTLATFVGLAAALGITLDAAEVAKATGVTIAPKAPKAKKAPPATLVAKWAERKANKTNGVSDARKALADQLRKQGMGDVVTTPELWKAAKLAAGIK